MRPPRRAEAERAFRWIALLAGAKSSSLMVSTFVPIADSPQFAARRTLWSLRRPAKFCLPLT